MPSGDAVCLIPLPVTYTPLDQVIIHDAFQCAMPGTDIASTFFPDGNIIQERILLIVTSDGQDALMFVFGKIRKNIFFSGFITFYYQNFPNGFVYRIG